VCERIGLFWWVADWYLLAEGGSCIPLTHRVVGSMRVFIFVEWFTAPHLTRERVRKASFGSLANSPPADQRRKTMLGEKT